MYDHEKHEVRPERELPGVPQELVQRVLEKSLELEPDAIAVLLRGSYATETAHEDSDLDLTVITGHQPATPYRAWFEEAPGDRLLPISLSAKSLEAWLRKNATPAEWALGFPATDEAAYLWSSDGARQQLGEHPSTRRPAGFPSLEDFVNTAVKARTAAAHDDSVGLRLYARETALLAPALLRKVNPEVVVKNHREAVLAARDFPASPEHYREDFSISVGLTAAEDVAAAQAIQRLATELVAFLRERDPHVDPQPDIAKYLLDGTLERYLAAGS